MLEFPRTAFALSICLIALLILSGFRHWLYFTRRSDFPELGARQRFRLFWVGLRLDGVIVSRGCLLLLLAVLLLPDSLFSASRTILWIYCAVLYFALFLFEIAGLYFFRYYDFRPNYLVFEHGADAEVIKTVVKAYPVGRILFLSFAGTCVALVFSQFLTSIATGQTASTLSWYWDRGLSFGVLLIAGFAPAALLIIVP